MSKIILNLLSIDLKLLPIQDQNLLQILIKKSQKFQNYFLQNWNFQLLLLLGKILQKIIIIIQPQSQLINPVRILSNQIPLIIRTGQLNRPDHQPGQVSNMYQRDLNPKSILLTKFFNFLHNSQGVTLPVNWSKTAKKYPRQKDSQFEGVILLGLKIPGTFFYQ